MKDDYHVTVVTVARDTNESRLSSLVLRAAVQAIAPSSPEVTGLHCLARMAVTMQTARVWRHIADVFFCVRITRDTSAVARTAVVLLSMTTPRDHHVSVEENTR